MRPQDILDMLRREPFRPFRIHLSNGDHHDVRHPELVMVFPRRVVIAVPSGDVEGLMSELHYCAILHITSLEELAEAG